MRSCLSRRYNGDEAAGLEGDEVRELVEVLESLRGAYEDEDGDGDKEEDDKTRMRSGTYPPTFSFVSFIIYHLDLSISHSRPLTPLHGPGSLHMPPC